jgi:formylmethanofuran dehydrogenase subunit B
MVMNNSNYNSTQVNATCPACGLLCDDISVVSSPQLTANKACVKGVSFFKRAFKAPTDALPLIAGQASDLDSAINKIVEILQLSKNPLFAGLGTEVQGMRSVMRLAQKTNASLDHMHSEAVVRNTLALQNGGWMTTTLAEVKNRADLILAIGTDITSSHPRFFERLTENTDSLFKQQPPEVVYLGTTQDAATNVENLSKLPEILNALNALLHNKKLQVTHVADVPVATLQSLITKLKSAQYAVLVWSASMLNIPHAELTIQSITQLINKLNETTRAAGLPLNSGDGDTSVNNTSTWLSGYPTRLRFNNGIPEYDNYQYATSKQLANCDAMLWISTFNPHPPIFTKAPTIVIGHPDIQFERMPDVFIPVGVPGVDHNGLMLRMDSSITLPLKKLRDSNLPSLNTVIAMIEEKLSNEVSP